MIVSFDVLGTPAAKGSPHARVHNGHVVMHEGPKTKAWEWHVREAAAQLAREHWDRTRAPIFVETPLAVSLVFRLARPAGHWGKGKNAGKLLPSAPATPAKKPDIDKLTRSTLDALVGSIMDDDSRVVLMLLEKRYASAGDEGASIRVQPFSSLSIPRGTEAVA